MPREAIAHPELGRIVCPADQSSMLTVCSVCGKTRAEALVELGFTTEDTDD
jgi:hypothetical protein